MFYDFSMREWVRKSVSEQTVQILMFNLNLTFLTFQCIAQKTLPETYKLDLTQQSGLCS